MCTCSHTYQHTLHLYTLAHGYMSTHTHCTHTCYTRTHCTHTQKNITVKERPLSKHCLDSSDVFILDLGLEIFQVGITLLSLYEWFQSVRVVPVCTSGSSLYEWFQSVRVVPPVCTSGSVVPVCTSGSSSGQFRV